MSIHFYNVVPQSQNISIDEPIIIGDAAHKFCVIGNVDVDIEVHFYKRDQSDPPPPPPPTTIYETTLLAATLERLATQKVPGLVNV